MSNGIHWITYLSDYLQRTQGAAFLEWGKTDILKVTRENEPIRGSFTIDPYFRAPDKLDKLQQTTDCPGLLDKNLSLNCKSGRIDVDIHVVGENNSSAKTSIDDTGREIKRVDIEVSNSWGNAIIRMDSDCARHPFQLTVTCDGSASFKSVVVVVGIPKSFAGPFDIGIQGGDIFISSAVASRLMTSSAKNEGGNMTLNGCLSGDFSSVKGIDSYSSSVVIQGKYVIAKLYFVDELTGKEEEDDRSHASLLELTRLPAACGSAVGRRLQYLRQKLLCE